tara:strand:+ start:450 stop:677 length:228 start_codon:yes stop_codon:yes gene_type:complete
MSKIMSMLRNKKTSLTVVATSAFASAQSFAVVDVTAATTAISVDGTAAITAVGGALIGLAATAVVFKWVKGAIFG